MWVWLLLAVSSLLSDEPFRCSRCGSAGPRFSVANVILLLILAAGAAAMAFVIIGVGMTMVNSPSIPRNSGSSDVVPIIEEETDSSEPIDVPMEIDLSEDENPMEATLPVQPTEPPDPSDSDPPKDTPEPMESIPNETESMELDNEPAVPPVVLDKKDENIWDPERKRWRTWTSGQFTVRAKFVSKSGDVVKLEREDGLVIEIQDSKLSDADNEWINGQGWKD